MDVRVHAESGGKPVSVVIDGHEIQSAVLREGFDVDLTDPAQPKLRLVLAPRRLDIVGDFLVAVREQDTPDTEETD